ncbi:UDP-Glycosyltransferase superfamily protein [Hibiscus syriacus]|uniref:UDP-Glycosyltransferase superfamily protein n=1 Tax=Hibiscus syriacus TaxID=106335 RepID=A0A6A2ZLE1_HIBSY|nr:UDP-Glycosyltransferase superfamily protein [Hibiscus syriacus]
MLHSMDDMLKFYAAINKMEDAAQSLFGEQTPRPTCIISDMILYNTHKIAARFRVPRISFHGFCCFALLCAHNVKSSKILEEVKSDSEYFTVPGMPHKELESAYVDEYRKVKKAWCIGPVSLSHKDESDKAGRELIELGLGLETSNKPFIWVLRGNDTTSNEVETWIKEDGFEERTKGRGLVVKGWAPQVLILSHPAVGGFLTHCGWNSTIEGVSAGIPLITFPLGADQFCNEKLVVQILKIGVSLRADIPTAIYTEKYGFKLKKEQVQNAIHQLMDEGDEGIERRKRAKEFGVMAKKAAEVGGSSYLNMTMIIQDIIHQTHKIGSDFRLDEN